MAERKRRLGIKTDTKPQHIILKGNPGTGKTTIAELIAKLYNQMGAVTTDVFHEVKHPRSELIGRHVGETAAKVNGVIREARGFQFISTGEDDYGDEAINTLMNEMLNHDPILICAGYAEDVTGQNKDMATFLNSNPGLNRRFGITFDLPDYTCNEIAEMFVKLVEQSSEEFTLPPIANRWWISQLLDANTNESWRSERNGAIAGALLDAARRQLDERLYEAGSAAAQEYRTFTESHIRKGVCGLQE